MQRFCHLLFIVSFVALSWFAMLAVHELGHIMGAVTTGGTVTRVVLFPLAISRTDVSPNPHPAFVAWLGPIVGSLLPLVVVALVPRRLVALRNMSRCFAGFCLIANGAYIAIGSFGHIGDCGEMLRTGTPIWLLWVFGGATILGGLFLWHRLGSLGRFVSDSTLTKPRTAILVFLVLVLLLIVEVAVPPR
jgi:hypothetical protein